MSKSIRAVSARNRRAPATCDGSSNTADAGEPPLEVPAELAEFYSPNEWLDARARLIATRRARLEDADERKSRYFETLFNILWPEFLARLAEERATAASVSESGHSNDDRSQAGT